MRKISSKENVEELSRHEYKRFLDSKTREELVGLLLMQKDEKIPVSIFQNNLGPLEIVVKYLKEEKYHTIKTISQELNRSDKTIWATYNNIKNKKIIISESKYSIPVSVFLKKDLSILESLVYHLKIFDSLSYHQIALLISRDDRTVWTVFNRAQIKLGRKK